MSSMRDRSSQGRMLDRRNFFKSAADAAAGVAAVGFRRGSDGITGACWGHSKVHDMTHELHHDFPTYFGEPGFISESVFNFAENGFNLNQLSINEHTGTHMDAPIHFSADGQTLAEIPVENLVVPLCIIDIREGAHSNADYQVTPNDLKAYMAKYGPIPDKACVAMLSGWGSKVDSDGFRNVGGDEKMHFPGFHIEATQMLIEETGAVGMAVDTLSSTMDPQRTSRPIMHGYQPTVGALRMSPTSNRFHPREQRWSLGRRKPRRHRWPDPDLRDGITPDPLRSKSPSDREGAFSCLEKTKQKKRARMNRAQVQERR